MPLQESVVKDIQTKELHHKKYRKEFQKRLVKKAKIESGSDRVYFTLKDEVEGIINDINLTPAQKVYMLRHHKSSIEYNSNFLIVGIIASILCALDACGFFDIFSWIGHNKILAGVIGLFMIFSIKKIRDYKKVSVIIKKGMSSYLYVD